MRFTPDDVDAILAELRRGTTATVGGSRSHTEYTFREGAWIASAFDDGPSGERTLSEAEVRSVVDADAESFLAALDAGAWRACAGALLARDWDAAAHALGRLRAPDAARNAEVLTAVCAWPASTPSDALRAYVRDEDRAHTLYHKLMTAVSWRKDAEVSALADDWLDRVEAMLGTPCDTTRAMFAADVARRAG